MFWGAQGASTLRTVWFGDLKAPKPYAQHGLETQGLGPPTFRLIECSSFRLFEIFPSLGGQGRPNLMHSMVWMPRGAQTLRTVWFGDPGAPKPYAQYTLETHGCQNLTHSILWRPRGAQTLRTIWFGDPEAPKPYPQYGFGRHRGPQTLRTI